MDAFVEAASVPLGAWHISGTLDHADAILAKHPDVAKSSIYTAALLGDEARVHHFVTLDAENATAKGGLHNWDALSYLCFSRYLRLDHARSQGFVLAATALLDAGASANTGWFEGSTDEARPIWESAIYGAAGLAQNADLTRLLLDRGADPNDDETAYHVSETYNNVVMEVLVKSGTLNDESLTTLLLRKTDWHDIEGIRYLLDHGADPNRMTRWKNSALHHAIQRDNSLEVIELLLDHGGDPSLTNASTKRSATAMAARRGRADVLAAIQRRGIPIALEGVDALIAACASNDGDTIQSIMAIEPALVRELLAYGGSLLAEFAANGNTEGIVHLLDLGVDVAALHTKGDGYYEIEKNSTALHFAAWQIRHATVKLLIERGAPVDAKDAKGRTPLTLAVRACVDSHWSSRRSPESVEMLLRAGATADEVTFPSGYAEVDELLRQYRRSVTD